MPHLPKTRDSIPEMFREPMPISAFVTDSDSLAATDWQKDMQRAFRSIEPLFTYLGLDPIQAPKRLHPDPKFPILVTQSFASRMQKGDWNDPLLLQILPLAVENLPTPGFQADAVGDLAAQIIPGVLHKYSSRALLMLSPQCAIHCRYCFRREFPYGQMPRGQAGWDGAWEYLRMAEDIDEIIFSGGDPLFLDNRKLTQLFERAMTLSSIKTIRIHTRLPVVLPSRFESGLLSLFKTVAVKKTLIVVIHANHVNEIDANCAKALAEIRQTGAILLNQTVLLKDINDKAETLIALSQNLIQHGVLPYYLHQLDRVSGTAHFEVSENQGRKIIAEMREKLPGYAVPRYVQEIAGKAHKTPIH
jgi:L-lysine 2,3-aminomutase